jgi:benzoyl-CoA reductase subunit C
MAPESRRSGLARAREICEDRTSRVKELKKLGMMIIGYKDIHPVLEILTGLDLVPFRLFGDIKEPVTEGDRYMSTMVCPMLRSVLDQGLKGKYEFLDGCVLSHGCEGSQNFASIWRTCMKEKMKYHYFLDFPHGMRPSAKREAKDILLRFLKSMESYTGKQLTTSALRNAIELHNRQRALVREMYALRKPDPPLISGPETLQVLIALMSLPVREGNLLLEEVINEVKKRENALERKPRLLVWGSTLDQVGLIAMIEQVGANVVIDDTSVGSRFFWPDVELTDDPLEGLAYRYLVALKSPRTYRETASGMTGKDYWIDLENRFGHLGRFAREWSVKGAILQSVRYCDIHGYEVPALKDYFARLALPCIYIEHSYSESSMAPLRTRVQTFLEILQ